MQGKTFSLVAILEVASGVKLTDGDLSAATDLMTHIVGRPVFTHDVPQVQPGCAEWILHGLPRLRGSVDGIRLVKPADLPSWIERQREKFGDQIQIVPVPAALRTLLAE